MSTNLPEGDCFAEVDSSAARDAVRLDDVEEDRLGGASVPCREVRADLLADVVQTVAGGTSRLEQYLAARLVALHRERLVECLARLLAGAGRGGGEQLLRAGLQLRVV